jgi:uncharacterized protein DUF4386
MTDNAEPSLQQHQGPAPATFRPPAARWSVRTASLTAGAALLLMSVVAVFGSVVAVDGLVTPGDGARTAADILADQGLFRAGIASLVLVVVLDVVVAWALYRVLSPVDAGLSMLAAAMRLAYAAVFMVAVGELLGVVRLLDDDSRDALGADQVHAQALAGIDGFHDLWSLGLSLFGIHLLLIGYLAYRSGYVPKVLGVLLAIAGAGYAADSLGAVLAPDTWTDVSSFTFLGELLLALWLVVRARYVAAGATALEGSYRGSDQAPT